MSTYFVKIAPDNKLKPLKGNVFKVARSVAPSSIYKLQELGATVIIVDCPVVAMVDDVLARAGTLLNPRKAG